MDIDDPQLDPRLAAAYDDDNTWADDDELFLALVTARPGARVVDVGCGTGRLTTAIARAGHEVTGVDPNPAFLQIARAKPGGDAVAWIRGTSADPPAGRFDVALLTSHVTQEAFHTDDAWAAALDDVRRTLVTGGVLAFDTRDPAARAWESWPAVIHATMPDGSVLDITTTMTLVDDVAMFDGTVVVSSGTQPIDGPAPGTTWSRARWGYRFRSPELVREIVVIATAR